VGRWTQFLTGLTNVLEAVGRVSEELFDSQQGHTRSVRKVSDRIFLCEHLMDYNLARLHEPTLNLSAHA